MDVVGIRELRQNASEILREVEAGKTITVTVAGRRVALISPIEDRRWRTWEQVKDIFETPVDPTWADELREFDAPEPLEDPWERYEKRS